MWVFRGLRNGVVTTRWPRRPDRYFTDWHGVATIRDHPSLPPGDIEGLAELCPTGAIHTAPGNGGPDDEQPGRRVGVDQGRCIGCGRCIQARPDLFAWSAGAGVAALARQALVVPAVAETDETLAELRDDLRTRVRALGRSVHVRHLDVGSDGSDEWEVLALLNPVYDVHRLGIFFTATPRHADILLVTGAGARGMAAPLRRTYQGMPDPKVVIAAGTDAVSGGLTAPSYAIAGGVGGLVPVDVWVPGSPPSPFSVLHAILLALGRLPGPPGRRRRTDKTGKTGKEPRP
ncbi:MAG: NADH:ubiquinone oxidoreductase [Streptosporangiales bacterium]|nr:NADH:ubiquinone oxidoreductase [Streptosporangiales bacterium]